MKLNDTQKTIMGKMLKIIGDEISCSDYILENTPENLEFIKSAPNWEENIIISKNNKYIYTYNDLVMQHCIDLAQQLLK